MASNLKPFLASKTMKSAASTSLQLLDVYSEAINLENTNEINRPVDNKKQSWNPQTSHNALIYCNRKR